MGLNAKKILIPLSLNLNHPHSKIRKISIETTGLLLVLPKAGENLKEIWHNVKALTEDKVSNIRETTLVVLA